MMKFDLHMHTRRHSRCSRIDPFALVHRAVEVGLDGIVITEHDYLWTDAELEPLRQAAPDLVILAGIEISALGGDMLVYGVRDPFRVPRGIRWGELCREVHRQGGALVAAHPYRWGQDFDRLVEDERAELDGMELMSSNMDDDLRERAAAYQLRSRLPGLGNSDAHDTHSQGVAWTEFEAEIRSTQDLVEAIRSGQFVARNGCEVGCSS
jgi:predicted metal-dependent phosphoesterase TrpH